jgi:hypothetical protein
MAYKKRKTLASVTRGPRRPIFPLVVLFLVLCVAVGFAIGYLIDKSQKSGDNSVVFDGEQASEETLPPEYTNPPDPEATAVSETASPEVSAPPSPAPSATPAPDINFTIELLPADTDTETLPPKLADKYLPDYTSIEVEEPVDFSADKLEGTRVIAQNATEQAEIYFADVPGGIITVKFSFKLTGNKDALAAYRQQLAQLHVLEN